MPGRRAASAMLAAVGIVLVALTVMLATLTGCLTTRPPIDQRTTQGPTAREMLTFKVLMESGREPTFEEKRLWDQEIEDRIAVYLRAHPEKANALDVSTFRFLRQAAVGMDKEQILILLGAPLTVSGDQAQIAQTARRFWSQIEGNATEVWIYPNGWNLFFAGPKLIDITQYLPHG